jgi:integrase
MAYKSQQLKRVGECLYRNGRKTYFALIKVSGKQIKRSLRTDDLAIAKRRLAELRDKAVRLRGKESRNIRFEELTADWLESIKPNLKAKSWDRRRVAIVGLTPFFKGMPVKSMGYQEIDEWRRRRGAKISSRSHNIELETLKLLLRYAGDRGILLDNHADKFKRRKETKPVVRIPTRKEFRSLMVGLISAPKAVASGAAAMVEFLAYSGMRVGEAREVRIRDVDFENSRVLITGGIGGTKNREQRTIPLFPNLRKVVERLIETTPDVSPNTKLFSIKSPRGAMKNACERMGLEPFTVHALRHYFASNAIERDINFKVIAEWLGHKDGGVLVAKRYGHLRSEFSATMAERMSFDAEQRWEVPKISQAH